MDTSLQAVTQTAVSAQQSWGERIAAAWQKQVPAILQTGNLLLAAKIDIGTGNWMKQIKAELPFSVSTADKLMKIGACDHFKDSEFIPNLPASWTVLFELTLLAPGQFERGIEEKRIHPKMKVKDAKALRGVGANEPDIRKDSAMSILKRQLEESHRKVAHLEDQLATADAGSLFDLRKDSVKNIASVIVGNVSRDRALKIADEIKAALKKRADE